MPPLPGGCVIANDSDNKRCYLMTHQVRRLETPCFIVTNHDASELPNIRLPTTTAAVSFGDAFGALTR